ncbi:hypothetical protein VNO77_15343 [Canavalia gladiata]|uniref:Uncharacterized protein n=1 Tax=Canavalia gladiata TaxID=3824 RepID=A0AAN9QP60_CANGL
MSVLPEASAISIDPCLKLHAIYYLQRLLHSVLYSSEILASSLSVPFIASILSSLFSPETATPPRINLIQSLMLAWFSLSKAYGDYSLYICDTYDVYQVTKCFVVVHIPHAYEISRIQTTSSVTTESFARYNKLAIMYKQQRNYVDTIYCYSKVPRIDPFATDRLVNRGNTHQEIGRVSEAIQDYIHTIAVKLITGEAHANLASVYKDNGHVEAFVKSYMIIPTPYILLV